MPTECDGNRGHPHNLLHTAKANSRTFSAIASHYSRLACLTKGFASRLANTYRGSRIQRIEYAYPGSSLFRFAQWGAHTARQSWLYRWLTNEPDPDVIVIDLRQTWTVGSLLAVLEQLLAPLERAVGSSTSYRLARRLAADPLPTVSAALLGILLASLVLIWSTADSLLLAAYALAFIAAGAGLTVRNSLDALATSRVYALLVALLEPPEQLPEKGRQLVG